MYGNGGRCVFSTNDERPPIEDELDVSEYQFTNDFIESVDADFGYVIGCNILRQNSLKVQPGGAMVDQPKVMILDKAHSNVDTHSKKLIQVGRRMLIQDRTNFSIAHHYATICDSAKTIAL